MSTEQEFESMQENLKTFPWTVTALFDNLSANLVDEDSSLHKAYEIWHKIKFKGYEAKECMPPPKEKATAGRANPESISYWYLSEDSQTTIYEVRPTIGQFVSVAEIKMLRDLKIFDFTMESVKVYKCCQRTS